MTHFLFQFVLLVQVAFAEPVFISTRFDSLVPDQCRNVVLSDFDIEHEQVYYSIRGARDRGFTDEYPMERGEARELWDALKADNPFNSFRPGTKLHQLYKTLKLASREMGFSYKSEGEVLEALALIDLRKRYPLEDFYHTGGVSYRDSASHNTMGEIDVLVGRRADCKVVVVGETKLGLHRLGKAHQQIQRFERYISSYLSF